MRCPRCQHENREGRRFCSRCGAGLAGACPPCGFTNEPGDEFCGGCGARLGSEQPAQTKFTSPDIYTPRHLAEKILTSKAALEGERKQVTVLFPDLKGSMELLADRDPEKHGGSWIRCWRPGPAAEGESVFLMRWRWWKRTRPARPFLSMASTTVLTSILLLFIFSAGQLAHANGPKGQVVLASGDLRRDVFDRIRYFQPGTDRYHIPSQEDLDTFRQAAIATLRGDLEMAARLLPEPYKAVIFTDTSTKKQKPSKIYHLLIEADVTPTGIIPRQVQDLVHGWGTYFFDPQPVRELAIESPHPQDDRFTETQGFEIFTQLAARSFLLAGSRRCASATATSCTNPGFGGCGPITSVADAAHGGFGAGRVNAFQVVHEEVVRTLPNTITIQLHGNIQCSNLDVFLSNSGSGRTVLPGGNIARLRKNLVARKLIVGLCGQSTCTLCGTTSVQGRWTNGSRTNPCNVARSVPQIERFIHVEQNDRMRRQPENRQKLIDAIAATKFIR
jgi:Double zinc ribbon